MNEDFNYIEHDDDFRPFLEREMHDPTIEPDNPDNYDDGDTEPSVDVFDREDDSSSFESIGWGTDEDYGYYGDNPLW
jgi:hypothetical protein